MNNDIYIITTVTSNRMFAGTKADVFIELIGTKNKTGLLTLTSSENSPFNKGKTSSFEIKPNNDIGTLEKIRIGHNNKGFSANWHLDHVKIESKKDGRLWFCECNRWLSKEKDDKKIERELLAIEIDNYNPNICIMNRHRTQKSENELDLNNTENDDEHENELCKPFLWIYKDAQNLGNFFICTNDDHWLEFHANEKNEAIDSYALVSLDEANTSVLLRSKSRANYFVRLSKNKIEFGAGLSELKELRRNSQQSIIGDWACFKNCNSLIKGTSLWIYDDAEMGLNNSYFVCLPTNDEWIEIIGGSIYDKYTQVHGLTCIRNDDDVVLRSESREEGLFVKLSAIRMYWSESEEDFEEFMGYCGRWALNFSRNLNRTSIRCDRL